MMTIIKADLYRLRLTKGIYITAAVLVMFLVFYAIGMDGYVGISTSSGESLDVVSEALVLNGMNMPFIMMQSIDNQLYILLACIVLAAGADFSSKTVKNALASGVSRKDYYVSKLMLVGMFSMIIVTACFVIPTLVVTVLNGFGGNADGEYWMTLFGAYFMEMYLFFAMSVLGLWFVFMTKRIAFVNSMYIAFTMVPLVVLMILSLIYEGLGKLMNYEMVSTMRMISGIAKFESGDFIRTISVGTAVIAVSLIGTYLSFRKCDIK